MSPKSNRIASTREAVIGPSLKNDRNKEIQFFGLPYPKSLSSSSHISYIPPPSTSDKPVIASVI